MKILICYHRFPRIAEDLKISLEKLGIECELFFTTDSENFYYRHVILRVNKWARNLRLVKKGTDLFANHPRNLDNNLEYRLAETLKQHLPDAIIIIHGRPFAENLISKLTIPKIGWCIEPISNDSYLLRIAKPFDIYNSFGLPHIKFLKQHDINTHYLPHAVNPTRFYNTRQPKCIDIAFVGNWSPWRDKVLQAALASTTNIALYGPYWLRKSRIPNDLLKSVYKGDEIVNEDLNHLFNKSRIVLNASRIEGSHGLNMRFFEVPSTGTMLLTDFAEEVELHFTNYENIVIFSDLEDLQKQIKSLLQTPSKIDQIGSAASELVIQHHTYTDTANVLVNQVNTIQLLNKSPLLKLN